MDRKHQRRPALLLVLLLTLLASPILAAPVYTTTWTETNTFTSTISAGGHAEPTVIDKSKPCVPQEEGWTACGWVCCDWYQECARDGQCQVKPGFEEPPGGGVVVTTDGVVTTLFSAPFRVTGTDGSEATSGADSGSSDDDDGGGLSGGAIAGIVIGTLAGVGLLGMLCFCCIARGIFGAIFGKKKKRGRSRDSYDDDRYTRRGSRPSSYYTKRGTHSSWYGSGSSLRGGEKKKSGGTKWLGLGALAATLLALLNIKRDKKPERRTPTMYTDSYMYTDSTQSSSSSGGGSKHPSRHSRHTRPSHRSHSHYTRRTRHSAPRSAARSSRRSSAHHD